MPLSPRKIRYRAHDLARWFTAPVGVVTNDTMRSIQLMRRPRPSLIHRRSTRGRPCRTVRICPRSLGHCRLTASRDIARSEANQRQKQTRTPRHKAHGGASPASEGAHLLTSLRLMRRRSGRSAPWLRSELATTARSPLKVERPAAPTCQGKSALSRMRGYEFFPFSWPDSRQEALKERHSPHAVGRIDAKRRASDAKTSMQRTGSRRDFWRRGQANRGGIPVNPTHARCV
jgi:hypothetical protein